MSDIDDPFRTPDSVVRPRPGAGRRGAADLAAPSRSGFSTEADVDPLPQAAHDLLGAGLNPLVRAANPLLLLAARLRGTVATPDVSGLRRHAHEEIRRFEERARAAGVQHETVLAARYALCASLDEAVLSTPWGAQSGWAQQSLLVAFHREAWGGEKFFDLLDRLVPDRQRHLDLIELYYLCLALGFGGKYHGLEHGATELLGVQRSLYRTIREERGAAPAELSLHWQGLQDQRHRLIRYVPWWVIGAATLALLAVTFAVYHAWLGNAATPIHAQLAQIGLEAFAAPAAGVPVAGPTLKQLLASDEASGALSVDEANGRSTVTLLAPSIFASGSATTNAIYEEVIERVARAVARVPGRVLVVGHTDDQPLRSIRYADNFELSRERALSVVRILQRAAGPGGRFESTGAGPSQPRYQPESEPANRARNRRVEIIHVSGL
jgi:type VI secretion system protein ImpK